MFSNLAAVSLSSFYHCVIVIIYSSSSFNFELLSLLFFSPNSLSHVHLGSSCFFSLLNVHSSSVLSECRGECSCSMYRWIEFAPVLLMVHSQPNYRKVLLCTGWSCLTLQRQHLHQAKTVKIKSFYRACVNGNIPSFPTWTVLDIFVWSWIRHISEICLKSKHLSTISSQDKQPSKYFFLEFII